MLSSYELGYVLDWNILLQRFSINGLICSNDALMISLDILSMPGVFLYIYMIYNLYIILPKLGNSDWKYVHIKRIHGDIVNRVFSISRFWIVDTFKKGSSHMATHYVFKIKPFSMYF